LLNEALEGGIINQAEYDLVLKTEKMRNDVIQVDSFGLDDMPVNIDVVTAPSSQSTVTV